MNAKISVFVNYVEAIMYLLYNLHDKFPREENLKQQWLIKIKCRNIQLIQYARMCHAYCFGLNPGWKKMRFQLVEAANGDVL